MPRKKLNNAPRYKLIFNPVAGKKRKIIPGGENYSLDYVKSLFKQYQIPVDIFKTKAAGHASQLAQESIKENYDVVIAAGGDGTISEVAAGLIGSEVTMGILPFGTFMNIPTLLSIPRSLELAVATIKLARTRKIDVGLIHKIDGETLEKPSYFIENVGIGLEAELQQLFLEWEKGDWSAIFKIIKAIREYYLYKAELNLDGKKIEVRAGLIEISNGASTGAGFKMAPEALLNDHRLTVSIFKMSIWELTKYFLKMKSTGDAKSHKVNRYIVKKVEVRTKRPRIVHADAQFFGTTPVKFSIMPNALSVISGFPKPDEKTLGKRAPMDP